MSSIDMQLINGLIADGYSLREVAQILNISYKRLAHFIDKNNETEAEIKTGAEEDIKFYKNLQNICPEADEEKTAAGNKKIEDEDIINHDAVLNGTSKNHFRSCAVCGKWVRIPDRNSWIYKKHMAHNVTYYACSYSHFNYLLRNPKKVTEAVNISKEREKNGDAAKRDSN